MADWTAITGIIVSGVVGPAVGGVIAVRRMASEHRYARILGDRSEARSVLDEAAQRLQFAIRVHSGFPSLFLQHGAFLAERAPETMEAFHAAARAVDPDYVRLVIRFGAHHNIVKAHREAWDALVASSNVIATAAIDPHRADLREVDSAIRTNATAASDAYDRFAEAAFEVGAVDLGAA
jgi:hypothetical protein